jgi:hypothetical protein
MCAFTTPHITLFLNIVMRLLLVYASSRIQRARLRAQAFWR